MNSWISLFKIMKPCTGKTWTLRIESEPAGTAEQYQRLEETLKNTLLLAQQTAEEAKNNAQRKWK